MASILVVDDEASIRHTITSILRYSAHTCHEAQDGQAGLDLARRQPFDLIITDIMMPRLNGLQMLQALKTDPLTAHIPVLIISATIDDPIRDQALRLGAHNFILKPFTLRQLIAAAQDALKT